MLALNGVKLNVTGEENLTAQRPAVFIFNHRNNFDAFIVARAGQGELDRRRQEGDSRPTRSRSRSAS